MSTEIVKKEEKSVVFEVAGEQVKLTPSIVRQFIARGNKELTNQEVGNFINLCKYRKLNPFTNEAYPVKFGSEGAQLIVGAEAFKRKAEEHPLFEGYRAGIIVMRDKNTEELEGSFMLPTDQLLGGWCEVYVKNKKYPQVAKVSMKEYNKGQSTWSKIPCTMIRKVAVVQALREAFPSELGAMYSAEELGTDTSKIEKVEIKDTITHNVEIAEDIDLDLSYPEELEKIDAEIVDVEF